MYLRMELDGKTIELKYCKKYDAEFCGMELSKQFLVIVVYRSPGNIDLFFEHFDNLLFDFANKYEKILALGEFNMRFEAHSKKKNEFLSLINSTIVGCQRIVNLV